MKKLHDGILSFAARLRLHALRVRNLDSYEFLILVLVLAYGTVFSFFTLFKQDVFLSFAWDLGIFDQSLYSTIFGGQFLRYTAELFMIPSGCYFAAHFSPILLLLLPFYAIHPSSSTLLVLQAFALASAAFPLYLVVKKTLDSKKAGIVIVILYLLYPPLQGANWFDFHTQVFLPLFLFSMFYFIQVKQWKAYLVSMFLALMVEEHVSIVVFLMALYFFIVGNPRTVVESVKSRKTSQALISIITMIICFGWFFLAQSIKRSYYVNPEFLTRYKATSAFAVLGLEIDPLLLPIHILLKPQNVLGALLYDYPTKLFFIILLFGPLIFLPLKSKFSLTTLLLLVPSLLSDYLAYHTIGAQYPLFVVPLVFIALVIAMKQFPVHSRIPLLKIALVVSLIFSISVSPISPLSSSFTKVGLVWYPIVPFSYNEDIRSLTSLVNLIPPDASVLTQNHIFPHISARSNAYVVPPIGYFENATGYLSELVSKSDFVLLDLWAWDPLTATVFDKVAGSTSYGIYALGSKSLLFKKGYHDTPVFGVHYGENRLFQSYKDLQVNSGQAVVDILSKSGTVASFPKGFNGIGIYGPYTYLLPGEYNITFMAKVGEHGDGYVGTIDVFDDFAGLISKKDIYGFEVEPNRWVNFTLPLVTTRLLKGVEFRYNNSGTADVRVDGVLLRKTSTTANVDFGLMTFKATELSFGNKSQIDNENGFLVHKQNLTSDFFWWGPCVSLPSGNYTNTFILKFSPSSSTQNETIISLDVTSSYGKNLLVKHDVHSSDLNEGTDKWYSFTTEFVTENELELVEFRGSEPSPDYTIYLAFILVEQVR